MLPFSLGSCVVSFCAGFIITAIGDVRQIMWGSYVSLPFLDFGARWHTRLTRVSATQVVLTLGYGLMIMLDEKSSMCVPFRAGVACD